MEIEENTQQTNTELSSIHINPNTENSFQNSDLPLAGNSVIWTHAFLIQTMGRIFRS